MFRSSVLGVALALGVLAGNAQAATVQGIVTADNFYNLYVGGLDGGGFTRIGGNERTYEHQDHGFNVGNGTGSPCSGAYNWSCPEAFNFSLGAGQTIYLAVWDDTTVAESWIGQFTINGSNVILSNTQDWEYFITSIDNPAPASSGQPGGASPAGLPTDAEALAAVLDANASGWQQDPYSRGVNNGGTVWGSVPYIDAGATFLSSMPGNSSVSNDFVTLYRLELPPEASRQASPVPEPGALALLGFAAAGFMWTRRRKAA